MRTIIAAVDFSSPSINAAHYAADLSVAVDSALLLTNVVEWPVAVGDVPVSGYALEELARDSEKVLNQLKEELLDHTNHRIEIGVKAFFGSAARLLQQEADETEAFAVVVGTNMTRGMEYLFRENHTLSAIRGISTPVLVIPEGAAFRPIRKLALATDLTGPKHSAPLRLLKEWLHLFQPKLDTVCVVKNYQLASTGPGGSTAVRSQLEEFHPDFHFVEEENVKSGVEEYIRQNKPDMLVVVPGSYGFFSKLLHKSQSKQLIQHALIPILSILD